MKERIITKKQFGDLIIRIQEEKGFTNAYIETELKTRSLWLWKMGNVFPKDPKQLESLCKLLDIDISTLDIPRLVTHRFLGTYQKYFVEKEKSDEGIVSLDSYIKSNGYKIGNDEEYGIIIGNSDPMQRVFHLLDRIVRNPDQDSIVFIQGETGTGKELVAKALHYNSSRRRRPLVCINITNVQETLLESELFGHRKGSFTGALQDKKGFFESVDRGTLFLDEIGALNLDLQAKLLRVLQERYFYRVGDTEKTNFEGRVVVATKEDLNRLVRTGKFREDLFYRINVIPITLPPLREREDDSLLLFSYFVGLYNKKYGTDFSITPTERGLEVLSSYNFPGNVRELESLVKRGIFQSSDEYVRLEDVVDRRDEKSQPRRIEEDLEAAGSNGDGRRKTFIESAKAKIHDYDKLNPLKKAKIGLAIGSYFDNQGNMFATGKNIGYSGHTGLHYFFKRHGLNAKILRALLYRSLEPIA